MKQLAQDFNTAAQDSNPGPLSRESEAVTLSHCALLMIPLNRDKGNYELPPLDDIMAMSCDYSLPSPTVRPRCTSRTRLKQ